MIEWERRLRELLPRADVQVSGSSCLPGLDPADLDFVVFVEDVAAAAEILRAEYPALHADEWRADWAAFRDPGPPQVDVVVTREGSLGDKHHRLAWELLASDPGLLAEYRVLKAGGADYEQRKREFFERVVAML